MVKKIRVRSNNITEEIQAQLRLQHLKNGGQIESWIIPYGIMFSAILMGFLLLLFCQAKSRKRRALNRDNRHCDFVMVEEDEYYRADDEFKRAKTAGAQNFDPPPPVPERKSSIVTRNAYMSKSVYQNPPNATTSYVTSQNGSHVETETIFVDPWGQMSASPSPTKMSGKNWWEMPSSDL
uniref:uncharacterized protein LOC120332079 n=1 Tax=Styela clava TaxID=7725 RepID=UPI00193A9EBE|nr:uncharacterized protein LOC120332079 [Styela clava]